jgi:hypothetical protein
MSLREASSMTVGEVAVASHGGRGPNSWLLSMPQKMTWNRNFKLDRITFRHHGQLISNF